MSIFYPVKFIGGVVNSLFAFVRNLLPAVMNRIPNVCFIHQYGAHGGALPEAFLLFGSILIVLRIRAVAAIPNPARGRDFGRPQIPCDCVVSVPFKRKRVYLFDDPAGVFVDEEFAFFFRAPYITERRRGAYAFAFFVFRL